MPAIARRPFSILAVFAVLIAIVVLTPWLIARSSARASDVALASSGANSGTTSGSKVAPAVVHPLPPDFQVALIRAGLDAQALAAAGVASTSVLATLQAAADQVNSAPTALDSADADFAAARVNADQLMRKIQAGQASAQEISQYQTAKTTLANATSARQTILDGYFTSGISGLSQAQRTALTTIRANRTWELPLEYLVTTRSQADFVKLRDALANERIALDLPDTSNQSAMTFLSGVRAETDVAAALSASNAHLAAVTSSWNTAAGAN